MSVSEPAAISVSDSTALDTGLSAAQVVDSRLRHGSNALPATEQISWWRQYIAEFQDPTIVVLSAAAALAIILSVAAGETPLDGIAIVVAVIVATTIGFFNEYRAERDFEQLKGEFERTLTTVVRAGRDERLTFDQVVVGDLVKLEPGALVPADGAVRRSSDLSVDTAPIDGESMPKSWEDDTNQGLLLRGYRIASGTALMQITAVGTHTMMWEQVIARLEAGRANDLKTRTPLQERLDILAEQIGRYGLYAALAILGVLLFRTGIMVSNGQTLTVHGLPVTPGLNGPTLLLLVQYILVAITIVVVAVPEGLPLAVTVSLALSARSIARDHSLVRRPRATETIGQTDVICTDKTGTLTENRMRVQRVYWRANAIPADQIGSLANDPALPMLALAIALNSTAAVEKLNGASGLELEYVGNPTEAGLLAWLMANGQDYRQWRHAAELERQDAFSSTRKSMESVVRHAGKRYRLVKGAPEIVMAQCSLIETADGAAQILPYHHALNDEIASMSAQAMRILAIAYEPLDGEPTPNLRLLALFGLADPIRAGVREALQQCRAAGIDVKMVTGDNLDTARAIALQLGMIDRDDSEQTWLAADWRELPFERRQEIAQSLRVLARALPGDKEELVALLQEKRLVVAVTGDGVNDAPALQRADVGVAMGIRGTDIAKQASDIVLLDDNFRSLVRAVHWGRALFENIQKFIQFQLTINLSALAIIFFGTLLGITGEPGEPPLTVIQLLWINLIMDTFAVIALCLEPPTPDQMERVPKGRTAPFITRAMSTNIALMGMFFTVLILALTAWLRGDGDYSLTDSATVFSTYVFLQVFNEINARSLNPSHSPFQGLLRNRAFWAVIAVIVIGQVLMTQIGGPLGANVFRTAPLPLGTWALIIVGSSTALIFGELTRLIRNRMNPEKSAQAVTA
ncbi:MAG: calcium-translocating P-type ATPase, PMCA-type [Aggregatilineales bacterium]